MAKLKQGSKLIMVVDDDEDLAFLLNAQLKQSGYLVRICPGGINLMADISQYKPALVLLDIAMQAVDGSSLCREIKKNPDMQMVKILMMSGNHNVAEHASLCGADGFIEKPLSISTVITAVRAQLA